MAFLALLLATKWLPGASDFSVGRLGRYGYEVEAKAWGPGRERVLEFGRKPLDEMRRPYNPERRGYGEATWWLCFAADWADLRLGTAEFRVHHDGWDHGPIYLLRMTWVPKGYKVVGKSWKVNWTTLDLRIELLGRGERRSLDIVASVLSPALLLRVRGPELTLCRSYLPVSGRARATAREISAHEGFFRFAAAPLRGGLRVFDLSGEAEIVKGRGELVEPWLLLWCGGSPAAPESTPVLFALEWRPRRVRWDGEALHIVRPEGVGRVAVMPLYGVDFSSDDDHRSGRDWNRAFFERLEKVRRSPAPGSLPPGVLERARFWARALRAFPVRCEEEFRVDERRGTVEIRDRYDFEEMRGDFGLKPLRLAPLPPILSLAKMCGYPVEFGPGVRRFDLVTYFGPYTARPGASEASYKLPLPPWGEFPAVDVAGLMDGLKRRLSFEEFSGPIGHHWDACGTSWMLAARFLAAPLLDRAARWRLQRDAREIFRAYVFSDWKWTHYRDPNFGHRWLIHAVEKPVQKFETEWANGLVLCGVAAFLAYTGDTETIRRHWRYVKGAFDFFGAVHDWATMWTSADGTGNQIGSGIDPMSAGYSGLSAFLTVAKAIGEEQEFQKAAYLLAKGCVPSVLRYLYVSHKRKFWRWTCDLNWTPSEEADGMPDIEGDSALLTGWAEAGTSCLRLSQWMWGITFHLFPGWPDLLASFLRFAPEEFAEVERRRLFLVHGERWFSGPPKGAFDRPQHADLHVIALSTLRARPPAELLRMLREAKLPHRFIKPWDVAAVLSSPAEAWPLVRGRYFIEEARWLPGRRALLLGLGGEGKGTIFVRALSAPRRVVVGGRPAGFRYDAGTGLLTFEASLPARVEVALGGREGTEAGAARAPVAELEAKNPLDFEREAIVEASVKSPPFWPGPVVEVRADGRTAPGQVFDAEFDDERGPLRLNVAWLWKFPPKGKARFRILPAPADRWPCFEATNHVQRGWLSDEFDIVKGRERVLVARVRGGKFTMTPLLHGEPFAGDEGNGFRAGLVLHFAGPKERWRYEGFVRSADVRNRGPVLCSLFCDLSRWWGYFFRKLDVSFEGRLFSPGDATVVRCSWEVAPSEGAVSVVEHPKNGWALTVLFKGAEGRGRLDVGGSPGVWAFDGRRVLLAFALRPARSELKPEWVVEGDRADLYFRPITGMSVDRRLELRAWVGLTEAGREGPRETARRLALSLLNTPITATIRGAGRVEP